MVQTDDVESALSASPSKHFRRSISSTLLRDVAQDAQISVSFTHVNAYVPLLFTAGGSQGEAPSADPQEQPPATATGGARIAQALCLTSEATPSAKEKQVLFNITARVMPGEILALMGPSGSGKSSLLSLLGGRSTARGDGEIAFNGRPLTKATKRKLGYVSQDDLLYAELTVSETLSFTARLRLPRTWTTAQKLERAEMVLQGLGLDRCRDTIIGNQMMRGVSGGERKRVSIGQELLINPSVLFLDEPTSGLDSTTALNLMHTLRSLASGGRTVITSIHQPSSRLYQQMDKLLLLAEGSCVYYGEAHVCAHWFAKLGEPVPFGVSTADHILDLSCGDVPGRSREESKEILEMIKAEFSGRDIGLGPDGIRPEDLGKAALEEARSNTMKRDAFNAELLHGRAKSTMKRAGTSFASLAIEEGVVPEPTAALEGSPGAGGEGVAPAAAVHTDASQSSGTDVVVHFVSEKAVVAEEGDVVKDGAGEEVEGAVDGGDSKWGATWFQQVQILTLRAVKTRRFSALSSQRIVESMVVGVLSGLFWFQLGIGKMLSSQDALDIGGLLFFIPLFLSFSAMFQAIFNYPSEFLLLVKERQSGMYRLSAYYLGRTLSDLPMDCLLPSLLFIICYFMGGLRLEAGAFFASWWSTMLIILVAQSAGLLIGATVSNVKNCLTLATITMLTIMLVGGFYVRGIPVWIAWMKYTSFIYWGWNLLLKIEFAWREMQPESCIKDGVLVTEANPCTVARANIFVIDVDAPVYPEVLVLFGMLLLLRIVTYYALNKKTTFKGNV